MFFLTFYCFLQLQPQYPRVAMMIVNRLERLKSEQPKLKVIVWEQFVEIMHNDVNRLITERQLSYLCKCLANAGVVSTLWVEEWVRLGVEQGKE